MQSRASPVATLFPLILAGLLAGMSYWLYLASQPPAGNNGKSRHDPDYMVEDFEVRRFGPDGALQHTLRATLMRHYPDDDSTVVLAPDLTYHRVPPTHVTAREAQLDSGAKHVELIDDVVVTRGGLAGKPDSILTTTRLHAYPDDELATTDVPVTITQGKSNVRGSGLRTDNKTGISVLEGPVHGIFHRDAAAVPAPAAAKTAPAPQQVATPQPTAKPQPRAKPKPKPRAKPKSKPQPKR